jgi:hypothetical protein
MLTEKLYDNDGNLLLTQPYTFRRLFKPGQEQIINSTPMTVITCDKDGDNVVTVVKLHGPWPMPNVKVSNSAGSGDTAR